MSDANAKAFSKLRSIFFPVHNRELKKFIPMSLLMFFMIFNYKILVNMKDTLVVNSAGASSITFLKLYCVTPVALFVVMLYMKLVNIFSREAIFYFIVSAFLAFFLVFAFVLYPNVDAIHPSQETVNNLYAKFPNFKGFIDIFAYWSYSLFYILAEIWGSIGVQILFWQFANQVVNFNQAKRFFVLFATAGNLAPITVGLISNLLFKFTNSHNESSQWSFILKFQLILVCFGCVYLMIVYRFLNLCVLTNTEKARQPKLDKKTRPSLLKSVKLVFASKHLMLIALLVIAYGVSINLVEVQWKNQIKIYFAGNKAGFNNFMNSYSLFLGLITTFFGWLGASGILRKLSWLASACVTPVTVLMGGFVLFASIFMKDIFFALNLNPVAIAVFVGAATVLCSKTVKYSLFDPTKEMAYMPLDVDLMVKGKPAVEVVGGRFGKAGGAFVQSTLLSIFAVKDVLLIAPYSVVIFGLVCVGWIYAVKFLNGEIKTLNTESR